MSQTLVTVAVFVLLLALVPFAVKWIQSRSRSAMAAVGPGTRVMSALAVGPHQRVVTVEVGPQDAPVWLVLGVTQQTIVCLHTMVPRSGLERDAVQSPAAAASGP